ncbi:hypothetical protein ACHQM5_030033 [Ranunculus cassubicifolius]
MAMEKEMVEKIDVGVILDMETWIGKMTQSCLTMAVDDYYKTHTNTKKKMVLHIRDSNSDSVAAASSAIDLMKNVQVQAILGPQKSSQTEFVVDIGNKTQVPIISFAATSPSISSTETPYFIRTALNDSTQVKAIAALIQAYGWREVVPIYEDTDYGKDMIPYLIDAIQDVNARVPYRSVLASSLSNDQIERELYKLMTMQTRVFVVHMRSSIASRLFLIANKIQMMSKGYVWIITDGLTDVLGSMKPSVVDSMQGVLGVKPYVPSSEKLKNFRSRWRRKFVQDNPDIDEVELGVFGLWAYDSAWALANAIEQVTIVNPRYKKRDDGKSSTDLESLGTSQIGPSLLQLLSKTKLMGLSGEFCIKDGQLQSSAFQIVNVVGKGARGIGFWSPSLGTSKTLEMKGTKKLTVSKDNLGAIIWPGDSVEVPKGWELPTSEKKLRIGVPVKDGFSEFVKVVKDPRTNATYITGFCIDVFKVVMESMPYAIPYEFVPFAKADGTNAGDYNELVDQISLQLYDGVVGDLTILSNRSLHVDFTLPFSESGVSMVVRVKDDDRKNAWIFLKPLTMGLWLTTGAFFILTGATVWVLEHRINEDFRGTLPDQIATIFWFSFSTLVFAQKEKVLSYLARFVMIIWIFVVLILTSSYTASLTSMLTVQQLQPTIADIRVLQKSGDYIGYQRGSFVTGLMKSMGLDPSKFRPYNTVEEYHEALSKGSQNGGVSAIMDETSYIKLFISKYCTKYMMVGPTHKTAGFGFAFPKGSPLVHDISRTILNVTEGDKIAEIEQAWFGRHVSCQEQESSSMTSDSLTVESFKGLFLIAGVASFGAFIIYVCMFLYEHRDALASEDSISTKISFMAKQFDKKQEISSDGSKKVAPTNGGTILEREGDRTEYDTSYPQSPVISPPNGLFPQEEGVSHMKPSTPIRGEESPPVEIL